MAMESRKLHDVILSLTASGQSTSMADEEEMKHVKKACKAGGLSVVTDVFR